MELPRLVLHFNTTKTVWSCDGDNDKSTEFVLQEALAETSWGTLNPETNEWELSDDDRGALTPKDDSLISYLQYLKNRYPLEGDHLDGATIEEHKRQVRLKTQEFTSKPVGQKMRPTFEQMVKNLSLPKAVLKAFGIEKAILDEKAVPKNPLGEDHVNSARYGRIRLIPSFLSFVTQLIKEGRKFNIIFRGFGTELEDVVKEWNLYCDGKHPAFNGQNKTKRVVLNGEKNSRDMRVPDVNNGTIDRMSQFLEFPQRNATPTVPGEEDLGIFSPTKYSLAHGIYAGILEISSEGTVSMQDDYDYYTQNEKTPDSSKLLLLDPGETKIHQIFFDGTLGTSALTSTVDVREVAHGNQLRYEDCIGVDIWRVNLVEAINDPNYYANSLAKMENAFQHRIKKRRELESATPAGLLRGTTSAEDASVSSKRYLYENIIPALLPALEICARDRPDDPLELIAFYMLRHKTQYTQHIKIVEPPPAIPPTAAPV